MKNFRWSQEKNEWLKKNRGISFEQVLTEGEYLETISHPKRKNQKILIFKYKKYPTCVPFVESADEYFLKTIFPDRTKKNFLP